MSVQAASVEVVTFGCRLNSVESEAMREAAMEAGERDLVIINTCAVTAQATREAARAVRRMARTHPDAFIAVTGCAAQTEPQRFLALPDVGAIIGNDIKAMPATWRGLRPSGRTMPSDMMRGDWRPTPATGTMAGHSRSFLQIQNGCDHRCTFCIIPFGRGPSRSTPLDAVIADARRVVASGVAEIVLTGVDLTSWGQDLQGAPKLGALVQGLLGAVPELARLRLSSLDCIEIDDDLLVAVAQQPRLMPHLHLSLQAGDDMILKRMKRRHMRHQAVALCDKLRRLRPDMVLSADIIVGFPTETEAMFQNTLALVKDCGLASLHVFPYSPRPGTPAARMPAVDDTVIRIRAAKLRAMGEDAARCHRISKIGQSVQLLMERGGMGRTPDFIKVRLDGQIPGTLVNARITHEREGLLCGEALGRE